MKISRSQKAVVKIMDCSLQTEGRTPLLRITPAQLIGRGEVELIPTYNIQLFIECLWCGKVLCRLPKEKRQQQSSHETLYYNLSCLHDTLGPWWLRTCVSRQTMPDLT